MQPSQRPVHPEEHLLRDILDILRPGDEPPDGAEHPTAAEDHQFRERRHSPRLGGADELDGDPVSCVLDLHSYVVSIHPEKTDK